MQTAIASAARQLKVGGFVPFTATDYPGKLAAVVFVQGCPWQCAYCHNPHLQVRSEGAMPWHEVVATLERRKGLLDAVVFSGGEPTLDPALEHAMREVRTFGYQIGLHTGGAYPRRLAEILPLIDWVGFDAKAPFADYHRITGVNGSGEQALTCAQMILDSGIAHEFRTTVHPDLISEENLLALAETLSGMGVKEYALQMFRKQGCSNETLAAVSSDFPGKELTGRIAGMFQRFAIR